MQQIVVVFSALGLLLFGASLIVPIIGGIVIAYVIDHTISRSERSAEQA